MISGKKMKLFFLSFTMGLLFSCNGNPTTSSSSATDTSLAKYVCTKNIATTPGSLKLLPVGTTGTPQVRGYAEYVPPNYTSKDNWPVIINLHGDGELGDGLTEASLTPFTYSCLPGMIYNNTWDKQHRFVVLSPQFSTYADRSAVNVNTFVQYAKANYKIDATRIYMTAVSGGGVALGNYLSTYSGGEAAAVLPVSCYLPPIASATKWKAVPAWFLLGSADSTVKPSNVVKNYTAIMGTTPPTVVPKITLYTGVGHDANSVNKTYYPEGNDNKLETSFSGITLTPYSNIYDWFLLYHK